MDGGAGYERARDRVAGDEEGVPAVERSGEYVEDCCCPCLAVKAAQRTASLPFPGALFVYHKFPFLGHLSVYQKDWYCDNDLK